MGKYVQKTSLQTNLIWKFIIQYYKKIKDIPKTWMVYLNNKIENIF